MFAFLSWRRWPDLLVDFGEELYVPWRLTQGEVLYRDVAFIGGYLLRKRNPTPYQMFTPFEFQVFGEETVTRSVIRAAPDWVVVVTMDMSAFGRGNFGDPHYATEIRRFLDEEYEIAATHSSPPYTSHEFSAVAFRRRAR